DDYQIQVQSPDPSVNRGYLANAEQVRVQGVELDGSWFAGDYLRLNGALSYTDGKYVTFTNAPVPLEEVGGPQAFKDVSGGRLPGISKWYGFLGAELTTDGSLLALEGSYFFGADVFYRSDFSSSPSPSRFLNIDGYSLVNSRIGFKALNGVTAFIWSRYLTGTEYYEQRLAATGDVGQIAVAIVVS